MKIYLAASYARRLEMVDYAVKLNRAGHEITSKWITGIHEILGKREAEYAIEDLTEIETSDCVMCFTEGNSKLHPRGGRHVEFGYGVAHNKFMVVVGPRENAFYYLPEVYQFDTFEAAVEALPQSLDQ